jgi:hypothetical protein
MRNVESSPTRAGWPACGCWLRMPRRLSSPRSWSSRLMRAALQGPRARQRRFRLVARGRVRSTSNASIFCTGEHFPFATMMSPGLWACRFQTCRQGLSPWPPAPRRPNGRMQRSQIKGQSYSRQALFSLLHQAPIRLTRPALDRTVSHHRAPPELHAGQRRVPSLPRSALPPTSPSGSTVVYRRCGHLFNFASISHRDVRWTVVTESPI